MAKDDMNLIMFKILAYLYECMVKGKAVNEDNFKAENSFFAKDLSQSYINDICKALEDDGYTKGFVFANTWGGEIIALSYSAKITPTGFEFMKENKDIVLNFENKGGKILLIDAQERVKYNMKDILPLIRTTTINVVRTDNLRLSDRAKNSVSVR